jgi:hypothetical protein
MNELASGAAKAIEDASNKGWVETLVVLAFVAAYLGLACVVRAWLIQAEKRESRMAARIRAGMVAASTWMPRSAPLATNQAAISARRVQHPSHPH